MARKTNLPRTPSGLRSWLKGSEQGRALLASLIEEALEKTMEAKCRACENIRPYPKVLVVLRRLGRFPGADVYVEEGVSVRLVELPELSDGSEVMRLAEELLALRLPKSWRYLIGLPAKRIQSEVFRGVSLEETLRYGELLTDIESLRRASVFMKQPNQRG